MKIKNIKSHIFSVFFACMFFCHAGHASAVVYLLPEPTTNNQDAINTALGKDDAREDGVLIVHLKSGTYLINDTIRIGSNTVLEGEEGTIVKLADNANWPKGKAMIENRTIKISNVVIKDFQIDGNREGNATSDGNQMSCGMDFYNMIWIRNCYNLWIFKMYLHDNWNDVLRTTNCSGVSFFSNVVRNQGHDAASITNSNDVSFYDNNITASCDSGFRISNSSSVDIHNNILTGSQDGASGIEIDSGNNGVMNIYKNKIHGFSSFGVNLSGAGPGKIYIHHNSIYDCAGGVSISGSDAGSYENMILEFNTFDSNKGPALKVGSQNVSVRNNIFSNNLGVSGSFFSEGNCFANNPGATDNDIVVDDAGFADPAKHDYHLKSKAGRWSGTRWVTDDANSPCIDQARGNTASEPYPNGCKPDAGRYGNTNEASLSGDYPLSPPPENPNPYLDSTTEVNNGECYDNGGKAVSQSSTTGSGRICNGRDTCSFLGKGQSVLELLIKILGILAVLLMIAVRMLSSRAFPEGGMLFRIRSAAKTVLLVLIVVLILWILCEAALFALGYIDPTQGRWQVAYDTNSK